MQYLPVASILLGLFSLMFWAVQGQTIDRSPYRNVPLTPEDQFQETMERVKAFRKYWNRFGYGALATAAIAWYIHWPIIGTAALAISAALWFAVCIRSDNLLSAANMTRHQ